MTFKEFLHKRSITYDAFENFVAEVRANPHLAKLRSWPDLEAHVLQARRVQRRGDSQSGMADRSGACSQAREPKRVESTGRMRNSMHAAKPPKVSPRRFAVVPEFTMEGCIERL